ncbi:MAG: selenocysteine-specific translation elongation factor [Pyrinomonadaceae bacterium]
MDIVVGTSGHIDHGKTALVKALTGVDADRLPEEKQRGITIDLGYAEMSAGDVHFGFVDVPGHEKFVKNMLAGASGINMVLLVVAADEGVMPQTREHFDICTLLDIKKGMAVLTKIDRVDSETLELANMEIGELVAGTFLENMPIACVSSRTGEGIDQLKGQLLEISATLTRHDDHLVTRLPIDRSFSVKGFGAVVTGTLASGVIREGTELELLPLATIARVRGVQTHNKDVANVSSGNRVAVNLGGIDHSRIARGMILTEPRVFQPTQVLDTEIQILPQAGKALRSRQRVRVHIGTVEALGRVHVLNETGEIGPGVKDFTQIRLESPIVAVPGERFIVRSYSPQTTIGGGRVIDAFAVRHRRKELRSTRGHLERLLTCVHDPASSIYARIVAAGRNGLSVPQMQARTGYNREIIDAALAATVKEGKVVELGGHYISATEFDSLCASLQTELNAFHKREPLARGMTRESLRDVVAAHLPLEIFSSALDSLEKRGAIVTDRDTLRLADHKAELSSSETAFTQQLLSTYETAGFEVPRLEEALTTAAAGTGLTPQAARKCFQLFLDSGQIIKVSDEFYFSAAAIDRLRKMLQAFAEKSHDRTIDVPAFKNMGGISRKYAIPLLEYFDRERVTRRAGDMRLIL